ncbi:unnamed protein product, partial [Rotaria sp. Silwood2]
KLKLYLFIELIDENSKEYLFNCLWDTYEDIRQYSLDIIIKLNVASNYDDLRIRTLFDRILKLLSSTQPPETPSGSSLVQYVVQINNKNLQQIINYDNQQSYDQIYLLINHITKRLDNEVEQAKINLFQAAKNGPMYGCLSGINALLTIIHDNNLIVSSSSPEGMMRMELTKIGIKDNNENSNGQITSQMLLVCCWRTSKEISLLFSRLGQIRIKYILNENQY